MDDVSQGSGASDVEAAAVAIKVRPTLLRSRSPLASPAHQIETLEALDLEGADFTARADEALGEPLRATGIEVLQLNLGRKCNQTCVHCHVDAGPDRKEDMSRETADHCLAALARTDIPTVDITGGAPEMAEQFEYLVRGARELGRHVMDRCNLSILLTKPYAHLIDFLAEHEVEVVASLPHYRGLGTDRQRGDGVFQASIEALRRLNSVGYGRDPRLRLVLVTNPVGAFLPGGQASLEGEWKREMKRLHDVDFNALYAITNMPISRYLEWLEGGGKTAAYMRKLLDAFNPDAVGGVMCRTTLSVGWDGRLFDCDFNQMLDLEVADHEAEGTPGHIRDFDPESAATRRIVVGRHCFGCTAGAGSSCGGATV
ncbi:MAG: arsenosugar biosynthesis radical SAM (seleno)protein ArsS [Planctomycetota bacterium]